MQELDSIWINPTFSTLIPNEGQTYRRDVTCFHFQWWKVEEGRRRGRDVCASESRIGRVAEALGSELNDMTSPSGLLKSQYAQNVQPPATMEDTLRFLFSVCGYLPQPGGREPRVGQSGKKVQEMTVDAWIPTGLFLSQSRVSDQSTTTSCRFCTFFFYSQWDCYYDQICQDGYWSEQSVRPIIKERLLI